MILLDYSQVMIANILMSLNIGSKGVTNVEIDENIVRHMLLNSIRAYRTKFYKDYGEIVLACDATNVWRKQIFPYYKAKRKQKQDSTINWQSLYNTLNKLRDEVRDNFPYKVLHIDTAEGDDIIGAIAEEYGSEGLNIGENILIISTDQDFIQLQKYENVKQYNPVTKKWMTHSNPYNFLKEHIIRGCDGDGVPNIMSEDNCFVINKRQKSITKQRLESFMNSDLTKEVYYFRNRELIDLSYIPDNLKQKIVKEYDKKPIGDRENLLKYFMDNKLKLLTEHLGEY